MGAEGTAAPFSSTTDTRNPTLAETFTGCWGASAAPPAAAKGRASRTTASSVAKAAPQATNPQMRGRSGILLRIAAILYHKEAL